MPIAPLTVSAYTAVNALGRGVGATLAALRAGHGGLRPNDLPHIGLDTWIGRVDGLEAEPLPERLARYDCRNQRLARAALREDGFQAAVEGAKRRYGAARIGLFLGTSTSGIQHVEDCYRGRASPEAPLSGEVRYAYTQSPWSLAGFCGEWLGLEGPAHVVSTACSSSAKVFASAWRQMRAGLCDAAVVGGVDSLCATTLYGFNSLQLVSARPCRPWSRSRDGLSIGEAAGFALLEWPERADGSPLLLLGFGESSDAYHMSAPHPQGDGAVAAMQAALASAGVAAAEIDYVNLHGTATPANDASEDQAIRQVFGDRPPACSSTKGWTGHTLGAAGITEAVIGLLCLEHGLLPRTLNSDDPDPALATPVLLENRTRPLRRVISNSFGFGGSNCALILGRP